MRTYIEMPTPLTPFTQQDEILITQKEEIACRAVCGKRTEAGPSFFFHTANRADPNQFSPNSTDSSTNTKE